MTLGSLVGSKDGKVTPKPPLYENKGIKFDDEKIPLQFLSTVWIEGVGRVLQFGAKKYEAHNWRKGIPQARLLGACLRHVFAYLRGEDLDPETGLSHLLHASCCLMFAYELKLTKPELDDRHVVTIEQSP